MGRITKKKAAGIFEDKTKSIWAKFFFLVQKIQFKKHLNKKN